MNRYQHVLDRVYKAALVCEELKIYTISYKWNQVPSYPGKHPLAGDPPEFDILRKLLNDEGYEEVYIEVFKQRINARYHKEPIAWLDGRPLF